MIAEPRVSIVVCARNDDHGGDLLRRMQIFVDGLVEQAWRHRLSGELIIVEWNPPVDRPRLIDALQWPQETGPCRVRIIEVSAAIHRRYRYADRLGLFQMIAKNVGIRRARGRFVLATNIDLLFSDALVRFLATGSLNTKCMYRIDRFDVSADVPLGAPVSGQLDFCRRHVLRVCTRWGTFAPGEIHWFATVHGVVRVALARAKAVVLLVPGRLRHMVKVSLGFCRWHALRIRARWSLLAARAAQIPKGIRAIINSMKRLRPRSARPVVRPRRLAMTWQLGRWSESLIACVSRFAIVASVGPRRIWREVGRPLHTNACGDFTLLARERWFALRGYPEVEMFSLHLDSVLCQMASSGGAREVVLGGEMRAYHIEHASGWSPGEATRVAARMTAMGVPMVDRNQYKAWVEDAYRCRGPIIFNGEQWGLAEDQLVEIDPIGRGRETDVTPRVERVGA